MWQQTDFLSQQKRYPRVRTAIDEKQALITQQLKAKGLTINSYELLLVAYKDSDELELYVKSKQADTYQKLATYAVCKRSGGLGPKRQEGDLQVPEGFYHIDRFNPSSSFHLSLGLNYPNQADRLRNKVAKLGGDIFIHGACVTVGCLPMTDDKIKEIYLYAVYAKHQGQEQIPVYVFPFRMTDNNVAHYRQKYRNQPELLRFWQNLKIGYDTFAQNKKALKFTVAANGDYSF
jgi:murein L,D-transpeptidase YafK